MTKMSKTIKYGQILREFKRTGVSQIRAWEKSIDNCYILGNILQLINILIGKSVFWPKKSEIGLIEVG